MMKEGIICFSTDELVQKKNLLDLGEDGEFLADEVEMTGIQSLLIRGTWLRYEGVERKEVPATLDVLLTDPLPKENLTAGELLRLPWDESHLEKEEEKMGSPKTCPGCGKELPHLTSEILQDWEEFKKLTGAYPCGGFQEWHDEEAIEKEEER